MSRSVYIRPAGGGVRPRTLRRSRAIRVPQSREAGSWQGHQGRFHRTDERGIRTPSPYGADRSQLGRVVPRARDEDRECLCLVRLRITVRHNGHHVRPLRHRPCRWSGEDDQPADSRSYRNPRNSLRLSFRTVEWHDLPRTIRANGDGTHARVRHDGGADGRGCGQEPQEWGAQPERSHAEGSEHGRGPKVAPSLLALETVRLLTHHRWRERCHTYEAEACQETIRQLCPYNRDGSSAGHILST